MALRYAELAICGGDSAEASYLFFLALGNCMEMSRGILTGMGFLFAVGVFRVMGVQKGVFLVKEDVLPEL